MQCKAHLLRGVASRHRDAFDQCGRLERLRMHREVARLPFGQGLQVPQLRVQQHRRAAHSADQLVVLRHAVAVAHLEDVKGGDDALKGGAKFVADFGEEFATSSDDLIHCAKACALFFNRSYVVDSSYQRRKEDRNKR